MSAPVTDEFLDADKIAERAYTLQHYVETARIIMEEGVMPCGARPDHRRDGLLFSALVIAQAILEGADVCTARLERIADTLDDLVEAIERSTEGDEVPAC